LTANLKKNITTLRQQQSQSEARASEIRGELSSLGSQLSATEATFTRLRTRLSKGADIFSHTTTRHEAHEAQEENVSLKKRREQASGREKSTQREMAHCGTQIVAIQAKIDQLEAIEAVSFFQTMGALNVPLETATEIETAASTTPIVSHRKWKIAAILSISAAFLTGGGFLYKKHLDTARTFAAEKATRLGDYFTPEELAKITPEDVEKYNQLVALIRDANRNHNLNLSEEKIAELVRLGDPLTVSIAEPRLIGSDENLRTQLENTWDIFFKENRAQIIQFCSEKKFDDLLSFMREKSTIFAVIPDNTHTYTLAEGDKITLRLSYPGKMSLYFSLGQEMIPEKFVHLATALKSAIKSGNITIQDIGIVEKNSNRLSEKIIEALGGIERSKFSVVGHPSNNGEWLDVQIYNIDESSPLKGQSEGCMIHIGTALREYATQHDPDGIQVMEENISRNGNPVYIEMMVSAAIDTLLGKKSAELKPAIKKIEEDFRDSHHAFPDDFLNELALSLQDEIGRGPLGTLFGKENITVLCNSISAYGIDCHVYISRAHRTIFSGNVIVTSKGARTGGLHPHERYTIGGELVEKFMANPGPDFPDVVTTVPTGKLTIKPNNIYVTSPFPLSAGASFDAALQYVLAYPENSAGGMVEHKYVPDFGIRIGKILSLPRGLEGKAVLHPMEEDVIKKEFLKVPGLAGNPFSLQSIIHEGKKRAVIRVTLGGQSVDILTPEAEPAAIETNMNTEDQVSIKECIAKYREDFSRHGSILTLGNDLVAQISHIFRAKLTDLKVKPEITGGSYAIAIKITLHDGKFFETSIPASELSLMIQAHLTRLIETEKMLSQVDYLVKLNGAPTFRNRVQNTGNIGLLQQKISDTSYHIDFVRSGITVNTSDEPILRIVFLIEGHPTAFMFDLPAKGKYSNSSN
ncbi:hypothetical protein KA050_04020, partial [Candidatus Gracilibacteria bacterium]|nr:hypothetical protein [Candidatus Gracilibacteria bacterium]